MHPVFKKGNPHDPGSYRPIAILPALSKILEIVVRDALLPWFKLIGFLPDSQLSLFQTHFRKNSPLHFQSNQFQIFLQDYQATPSFMLYQ